MKTILHLCADTGSDSQPYRENGYEVICIGKDIGVENYHPPKKEELASYELKQLNKEYRLLLK